MEKTVVEYLHCNVPNFIVYFSSIGDKQVAARLASSPAAEAMLNGIECDDMRHKSPTHGSETGNNKTLLLVNENGTSDTEPPHGSVTGSNGFILTKQQQESSSVATPALGVSPHRTNWLPSGSPAGGHATKPIPASASGCAQSSGALRTDPSTGTTLGQGTPDTKNDTASSPVPAPATVTIHRARKTMSRPAVSPAQKVNIRMWCIVCSSVVFLTLFMCYLFLLILSVRVVSLNK